ncbi:hypothetical protein [uncultured Olleya sp.]|uniref:hypothetical protein n=1 Tax=uncultured Olleya sp. TaxID=757243 RepID=UPI002598EE1C|nr:hypothetical protein [uncultured Olleya sp.]
MKYILLVTLFCTTIVCSQNDGVIGAGLKNLTHDSAYTSGSWIRNFEDNSIDGSVYLFDEWNTKAIITTINDTNLSLQKLNYDIKSDSFSAKFSHDSVYVFNNSDIKEVILNSKRFIKLTSKNSFYECLAVGNNFKILKDYNIILTSGVKDPITQKESNSKYTQNNKYFFLNEDELINFKLKKKSILKLLKDKKDKIEVYVKNNKLSYNKEEDLIKLFNYYNTI